MRIRSQSFIDYILKCGSLSEARQRTYAGTAQPNNRAHWEKFSTWELICEEIVDTQHPDDWYDDVFAELQRRGLSDQQIDEMRTFAWRTAGWLNYDMCLWDWCSLDERDIMLALDWQLKSWLISSGEYRKGLDYVQRMLQPS